MCFSELCRMIIRAAFIADNFYEMDKLVCIQIVVSHYLPFCLGGCHLLPLRKRYENGVLLEKFRYVQYLRFGRQEGMRHQFAYCRAAVRILVEAFKKKIFQFLIKKRFL